MTLEEYAKMQQSESAEEQEVRLQDEQPKTALEWEQAEHKAAHEQAFEVYRKYQENIRKIGMLSTEIIKGLQRGENLAFLFLKAVKAYTLCTGNSAEYDIIEHTLLTVYGKALHDSDADGIADHAVRARLKKLKAALQMTENEFDKSRIMQAIKAHEAELQYLSS